MVLPVDFPYWLFAGLIAINGLGSGLFSSPNTSAVMGAVPVNQRGAASGMRGTFLNSGQALSIGVFFSLMIIGLASALPSTLNSGLQQQGVPSNVAHHISGLPPVSTLFAAFLGFNPMAQLLGPTGALDSLPAHNVSTLTGKQFFPHLISGPFHHGLVIVFVAAAAMMLVAAAASLFGNGKEPTPVLATAKENDGQSAVSTKTAKKHNGPVTATKRDEQQPQQQPKRAGPAVLEEETAA